MSPMRQRRVHDRLVSNLKHILVGLEMKAALVVPHAKRGNGKSLLYEPYFQPMNFEFCVGTFSICEGLGSALWLVENGRDGSAGDQIGPYNGDRPRRRNPILRLSSVS